MSEFYAICNLENLIKEPTSYKNPDKSSSTDHILTNHPKYIQHSGVYETGLSDFHKLAFTVLKMLHAKEKPQRDHKNFKTPILGWIS